MSDNFNPTPYTSKTGGADPGFQAVVAGLKSGTPTALGLTTLGNLKVSLEEGSVSVSGADGAIQDGSNSAIKATVLDYTNSNPLAVRLTDANGDYVSAGAGTQYTEDSASASNPTGSALIGVRADSLSAVTDTDGDNVAARMTNKGELYVKHADSIPVTDNGGSLTIDASSLPLPSGASTSANQTNGSQKTQIVDSGGDSVDIKTLGTAVVSTDNGIITNSVIHGLSTAGGGTYVDVKVNPSGALTTATTINDGTDTALVTASGELNVLATAQPGTDIGDVTINNASGASAVNIQDGGNSITVDATSLPLPTGASTLAEQQTQTTALQLIDDTVVAQGTALGTTKNSLMGASVTTASPTYTTGQINPLNMTTGGALRSDIATIAGTAPTTAGKIDIKGADGDVFVRNATATNLKTQAESYQGGTAVSSSNPLQVTLANTGSNATAVKVDGSAVTQPVSYATTGSGTATGALRVELPTNGTGTLSTVSTVTTVSTLTGGGVAHDGVDSGNPIKIGHKAVSTQSGQTAVASGDRTDSITDLDGSLITRMTTHGDSVSGVATTTGTSDTSVVGAQGASTYFYVTGFTIANTGSTTTLITFKDGSGGSALWYTIAPTAGGSNFSQGGKPIFKTSANTALYFACASASTTVYVSVTGYKSKV